MSELCRSHRCAADEIVDHSDPGHRCSCECGFTWKWEKADAIVLPEVTPAAMFAVLVEKSAQIAELERQRDEVLALCDRAERSTQEYAQTEGLVIAVEVDPVDIRAIYGGGE